ncbi:MAG: TonB-dependent receptor [Bacteroidales bacterium]|nr:TonB-dependent receptor [Bacteroidales bacterium]
MSVFTKAVTLLLLAVSLVKVSAQTRPVVCGHVYDGKTGEAVPYASCVDIKSGRGAQTNTSGYFSFIVDGDITLQTTCIGYEKCCVNMAIKGDTTVTIVIQPKSTNLQEVVVSTYVPEREQVQMGKNTITTELIKGMPSFVGEPDILKSTTYLPGISSGKEGYSNIYVRGADRGQNLVLLDGIKIYNTSHVGGFLSLFNSDVVKHVDVYKGGFPAQYGGRASSVIDVVTKDGNREQLAGKASVGLISSSVMVEGPVGEKLSFYLAGRTSYYALFSAKKRKRFKETGEGEYFNYTFFDINGRLKWHVSPRSSIALSLFYGDDVSINGDGSKGYNKEDYQRLKYRMSIRNRGVSLTHTQSFNSLFWRNTISLSQYDNTYNSRDERQNREQHIRETFKTQSSIRDISFQSRLELNTSIGHIKTGVELSRYRFRPSMTSSTAVNDMAIVEKDTLMGYLDPMHSWEMSVYANDEITFSDKLSGEIGFRASTYSASEVDYWRAEPRLSARYLFSDNMSLKANYTMMNQYNHVIVTMQDGFEKEMWMASTKTLKPQHADQFSAGLFYGKEKYKVNASLEGFYKKMSDLITYRAPVENDDVMTSIEKSVDTGGKGRSYGVEAMVSKEWKNVSASVSYTLSWNERKFDDINKGNWYPFLYDRRHDLNVLAMWHINSKWSLSGNFVLSSGAPVSLPGSYVKGDGLFDEYYVYDGYNNRRLPLYHRLDIAVTRSKTTRRGNLSEWKFNLFNAYAHQNAQALYFNSWNGKVTQIAMFSIVPTVSYTITF